MYTQDFYTILGLSRDASSGDIRKAYRRAARKFHPDVNKDAGAEARFKEVGEAYEVLKDSEKRKLYDQYGPNWKEAETAGTQQGFNGFGDFNRRETKGSQHHYQQGSYSQPDNLDDILSELFGQAGSFTAGQDNFSGGRVHPEGRDVPQEYELQLSLEDIYLGRVKHISIPSFVRGPQGTLTKVNKEVKVTIPKGVTDGSVIRLGDMGPGNEKLHIRLKIQPHRSFAVDGYNLKTIVAVAPWEAMLDSKIPVQTLKGDVMVTVPNKAQNGKQLRIKGKGLTKKDGTPGDLIVILEIRLPETLTAKEKNLLKQLSEESRFDPRKEQQQKPAPSEVA